MDQSLVADFKTCPYCERVGSHEDHYMVGGRLEVPTPLGTSVIVMLVCVHALPDERVESFFPYAFYLPWDVFQASIEKFSIEKDEALKRLGKENIETMRLIERRFNKEED